jgi:hypothetical protein
MNDLNPVSRREFIGQSSCTVRRVVVDDDQLCLESRVGVRAEYSFNEIRETISLVVSGDDNGQRGGLRGIGGQRMRLPRTIIQPTLDE